MNAAARHDAGEGGIVACGVNTVTQENVNHVVVGVNPKARTGETCVSHRRGRGLIAGVAGFGVAHHGFVKSQSTVRIGAF